MDSTVELFVASADAFERYVDSVINGLVSFRIFSVEDIDETDRYYELTRP